MEENKLVVEECLPKNKNWSITQIANCSLVDQESDIKTTQPSMISSYKKPEKKRDEFTLRVVCISDTHEEFPEEMPEGDILIHTGDITQIFFHINFFFYPKNRKIGSKKRLEEFHNWMGKQNYKHKLVIAGNHDLSLDKHFSKESVTKRLNYFKEKFKPTYEVTEEDITYDEEFIRNFKNFTYLENETIEIEGLKIYASPYSVYLSIFHSF